MTFTRTQRQEAYKKLSPEVQSFIMDNETTDLIENYLTQAGFSEDQSNLADSEILYAMYGLQTLSDAMKNIAKIVNKSVDDLFSLQTNLDAGIFRKIEATKTTYVPKLNVKKVEEIGKKYLLEDEEITNLAQSVAKQYKDIK